MAPARKSAASRSVSPAKGKRANAAKQTPAPLPAPSPRRTRMSTAKKGASPKRQATMREQPDFETEDEDEEVLSEEIEGDDEDDFEILYLVDADKKATTFALRWNYCLFLGIGLMNFLTALLNRSPFFFAVWTHELTRDARMMWGMMQIVPALLLIAAAQTSYDGQKKALQYVMIGHILLLGPGLMVLARPDKSAEIVKSVYIFFTVILAAFAVTLYSVYFYVQKPMDLDGAFDGDDEEDEEEEEEEEESEEEDNQ